MSEDHIPDHPLEQAELTTIHPREDASTGGCTDCQEQKPVHVCHGDVWICSDCCDDSAAGEGKCQRFIARERAGTLLVNRKHVPVGWGEPHQWPRQSEVVDIGRARNGSGVITNTEPGNAGWLGNPYRLTDAGGEYTREESVERYRSLFYRLAAEKPEFRAAVEDLQGTVLMGWCTPKPCHGDVILEWLDLHGPEPED
jgi:hypothetical protein